MKRGIVTIGALVLVLGATPMASAQRPLAIRLGVHGEEQKSLGRSVPVSVLDKTLRRMRWEPEITPQLEKYLADQAKDLMAGAGEGRLNSIPAIADAVNKELLQKAKAGL